MCQVNIDAMGGMQLALAVAVEPEQDQATAVRGQEKAKLHGLKESHEPRLEPVHAGRPN